MAKQKRIRELPRQYTLEEGNFASLLLSNMTIVEGTVTEISKDHLYVDNVPVAFTEILHVSEHSVGPHPDFLGVKVTHSSTAPA